MADCWCHQLPRDLLGSWSDADCYPAVYLHGHYVAALTHCRRFACDHGKIIRPGSRRQPWPVDCDCGCAMLAATTGIVGATVVAMGLISLPAMMRNKYSPSLAIWHNLCFWHVGTDYPPSIVLIILADQLSSASGSVLICTKALYKHATGEVSMPSSLDVVSTSAGDMFLGRFLPGLVLVGLYLAYILVAASCARKSPRLLPMKPWVLTGNLR